MSIAVADTPRRSPSPDRSVAPFITEAVGDVSRPSGVLLGTAKLDHLPGEGGIVAGIRTILGWMRWGNAYLLEQQRRFGPVYRTQFGLFPIVIVSDPDLVVRIVRNGDCAFSAALAWRTTFEGVPAGAGVLAMIGPLMQDSTWWTDPQRFDPDRFTEARAEDKRHRGLFLPFGAGAHACIGAQLANLEVKAFWHAMLARCRFRLEQDYEGHHVFLPLGIVSGDVSLVLEALP